MERETLTILGLTESATNRYVEIAKSMAKVKNDFYLFLEEEYSDRK